MKIFACSDIHLDLMPVKNRSLDNIPLPHSDEIDLLIIAGDLGRVKQASFRTAIKHLCNMYNRVLFVAGYRSCDLCNDLPDESFLRFVDMFQQRALVTSHFSASSPAFSRRG